MDQETFKIEYRNIQPKDLDKIVRFSDRWIGKGYFRKAQLRDALLKGIREDINLNFVSVIGEKIIGIRLCYAPGEWIELDDLDRLSPGSWGVEIPEVAYFKSLFVHEKYQGKGIGSKLSKLAIDQMKILETKAILAHAWQESPGNSSRNYLKRMGFEEVAEHKKFWNLVDYECTRCGPNQRCICTASEMILKL
ncbi:MAG: GNAT family N-acetyltransferase [Halobacteriovoraceae bacterium]|nr:GNAT family N-acetyltransferase [Halobacteriovoraceae bacterium]|tara:strand:+ start:16870 stop:17448 length:579 start_codon:yes stop_codon:yes gene_type:complete